MNFVLLLICAKYKDIINVTKAKRLSAKHYMVSELLKAAAGISQSKWQFIVFKIATTGAKSCILPVGWSDIERLKGMFQI